MTAGAARGPDPDLEAAGAHVTALAQAVLVTFLWSTSWVLIKVGLDDLELPPLSFAGLRYVIAAAVLLPIALPSLRRTRGLRHDRRLFGRVLVLGVLLYAVAQGAQFAALVHLPAVAVGLVLTTTPAVVALVSVRGRERPTPLQLLGIGALIGGAVLYFGPLELGPLAVLGLAIAALGVLANAAASLLGRALARDALADLGGVVGLTAVSMAIGSVLLLAVGLVVEGVPPLTLPAVLIVGWLALVNTAFAFTLWNHTLRTLTAVESSVVNNLMLIQIAVLAWVFLGETLSAQELVGLGVALAGILAVQLARPAVARRRGGLAAATESAGPTMAVLGEPPRIVLVGMMGSGKTSIGRLLEARTGWPYHDNDETLVRLFDATPRQILDEKGEIDLRRMESEALQLALQAAAPCIVGVAAGTILDEENQRRIREAGTVVWLRASSATLARRSVGSLHRAWLDRDADEWIGAAVEERDPLYEAVADIVVDVDERSPAEAASEILDRLSAG